MNTYHMKIHFTSQIRIEFIFYFRSIIPAYFTCPQNGTFTLLKLLNNSYVREQFARLATRVSCEIHLKISNFTIEIAVDLWNSRA